MRSAAGWLVSVPAAAGLWLGIYGAWWAASIAWTVTAMLLLTMLIREERRNARAMHTLLKVAIPALQDDKRVAVAALVSIEEEPKWDGEARRVAAVALDELEIDRRGRRLV